MRKLVLLVCLVLSTSALAHRPRCHPSLRQRTPEQVLASHFENLATGNYEAERCNYAADAVVISDGGVTTGVDDIVATLQGFGALFGGQVPQVNEEIIVSILDNRTHMARTLFSISTPCIDIPDGTDTYIIRNGRIQAQTAHGFPVFKCGPPPPPPAP
jgi:hypothetical protein